MKRLVLIDGKSVFYRGYYAMPGLSLKDGTPTGGVYGFASLALEVIKKLNPDYVAVAWDKRGTNIRKRKEIYPGYKAGRKPAPPDFYEQIPLLYELLAAFNWPLYELDDYEADDIMGTLAKKAAEKNIEACLITGDLDLLQTVGPLTHVYALKKGFSEIDQYDPAYFEQKYGIGVKQFLDLKSLKGDSSDNIPGVPGIGEKTAIQLLQDYETLDGVYDHLDDIKPSVAKKLEAGKESAYLSQKVAEIWLDAPIDLDTKTMDTHNVDVAKVTSLLKRFEFHSLLRRLPKHMQDTGQGSLFDIAEAPSAAESLDTVPWPKEVKLDSKTPILVHLYDSEVWLSTDKKTVALSSLETVAPELWHSLETAKVVTYDAKAMYHAAHSQGVEIRFRDVHDLRQGAFLLDPLGRDRSVSGLAGEELNEADAGQVTAALWHVYDQQLAGFKDEPSVAKVAHEMDFPLTYMLYRMESRGIKIDKDLLRTMSQELGDEHKKLEQEMYAMAGYEFNIGSPAQLSEVLFTKLQLPTAGIKKGKTGYSTGQKELDKLRGQHPIIELIERTRELAKLKNTYVDTLPEQADKASRLHTDFRQDVAATGRLSSNNPNLQNIPVRSDLGRRIREAFVPKEGNVFVSADYSQFELRLAAVLANDEQLIADFNGDLDIHAKTASDVYGVPLDKVTKDQRRAAKVINFGIMYGMSPHGLSAAANMTFIEAKEFIDEYFKLRAPIRKYIDDTLKKADEEGYVETLFGRRRPTPDVKSSNFMVREGAKRAAANMPIQGTEADLMKMAMLKVDETIGDLGEQVLQVHDSILVECPEDNAKKIAALLKDTMENIYPDLKVKLKVDVSTGKNWGEL
ncbi:MAG TPA: DNA polymerase I [Candidatus Saccharimonadales bacterium]|nr:DNA polymerase I [Candidatus Saccharimonadales bacterium]